jgi:hypothetical protein
MDLTPCTDTHAGNPLKSQLFHVVLEPFALGEDSMTSRLTSGAALGLTLTPTHALGGIAFG